MVIRWSATLLLIAVICFTNLSCLNNITASNEVTIKGTVMQPDTGIGCSNWVVKAEDGRFYEIIDLPEEFCSPGIVVVARLQLHRDMVSSCMVGPIAEVVEIEKAPNTN